VQETEMDSIATNPRQVTLSARAVERLKFLQRQRAVRLGLSSESECDAVRRRALVALRVSVEGGGCSGFQYKFQLEDKVEPTANDSVVEQEGVSVIVDSASLPWISGARIDFQEELMRSAFVIEDNPHAAGGCSCGSSFQPKLD